MKDKSEVPVILLAKPTSRLAQFVETFDKSLMRVEIVSQTADVPQALAQTGSEVLVHILEEFERDDVGVFHHRLVRSSVGQKLHRFIVYRGTNNRAMAFAEDCGMRRAIQAEQAYFTLGATIQMALNAHEGMSSEVQEALTMIASGDCYLNDEQCAFIQSLCDRYRNLQTLNIALGRIGLIKGDSKSAIMVAKGVLSREPMNIRAMSLLGEALLVSGQVLDALKFLFVAEGMASGNPLRIAILGTFFGRSGDRANALKCLHRSIQIVPLVKAVEPLIVQIKPNAEEKSEIMKMAEAACTDTAVLEALKSVLDAAG